MSQWGILVVILLLGLAVAIAAADLFLYSRRNRRRQPLAHAEKTSASVAQRGATDEAARREAIRRRLAAIQVAGDHRK